MEIIAVTDSEDELPEGWEERVTPDGKVYYANHVTKSTQWEHPLTKKEKTLNGELPYGWERVSADGTVIFIDRINKKTSYIDPRLAFAKSKSSSKKVFNAMSLNNLLDENSSALDVVKSRDLTGSIAIVTGANRGVGFETVKALAYAGCHVIMACRNVHSAISSYESLIKERPDIRIEIIELNLASLKSVKQFSEKINSRNINVNILILNAAIFETEYKLTEDNLETMFQVNYLAQFYLARLLLENLLKSKNSRVVVVSCESHHGSNLTKFDINSSQLNVSKADFNFLQVYCNTKMCSILLAYELNRRLNKMKSSLICKSCHPGNLLPTKLFANWLPFRCMSIFTVKFAKTLGQAAANAVFLATCDPAYFKEESIYWNNMVECSPSNEATDNVLAYRLWEISENILIDRTHEFDAFLSKGDEFSSFTKLDTDDEGAAIQMSKLSLIDSKLNENASRATQVSN